MRFRIPQLGGWSLSHTLFTLYISFMITKVGQNLNVKPTISTPARQNFLTPGTWSEGCSPFHFENHQSPLWDFVNVFMCVCIHVCVCVYTTCNWVLFIHTRGGKQSLNAMPWSNDNAHNSQLPGITAWVKKTWPNSQIILQFQKQNQQHFAKGTK